METQSPDFIPFSQDSPEDPQNRSSQSSFRNDNSFRFKNGNKFRNNFRPYPQKRQNSGYGRFSTPYQNNGSYFHPSMLDDPWRFLERKLYEKTTDFEKIDNNSPLPPTTPTLEEQTEEDDNTSS